MSVGKNPESMNHEDLLWEYKRLRKKLDRAVLNQKSLFIILLIVVVGQVITMILRSPCS
jgi:hypothetical protein